MEETNNIVSIDVAPISAETTTKVWELKNPEDYLVINAYTQAKAPYRILEFYGRFFIEHLCPNVQDKYTDLEDTCYYQPLSNQYFKHNEFYTLHEAEEAFLRLASNQTPIIHPTPDFDEPNNIN